ncbi:hypothetical protein GCM10025762_24180 [Haloechinothrix salitolerans]
MAVTATCSPDLALTLPAVPITDPDEASDRLVLATASRTASHDGAVLTSKPYRLGSSATSGQDVAD